jgi:hypothetical protein
MRDAVATVVQIAVSVLVVGLIMPVVLVTVPASRDDRVGLGLSAAFLTTAFVVIRLAWPKRRP